MNTIRNIRAKLEHCWDDLWSNAWKCAAQKKFARIWFVPMLAEIDDLDSAAEELQALCQESENVARSVREPDENEE